MKHFRISFIIFFCLLLMGSTAPVSPSKGLYINDYATAVFSEHRDFIAKTSAGLDDKTGVQVIVLAVKNLLGMNAETYSQQIFEGWSLSGNISENAILILLGKDEKILFIGFSEALSNAIDEQTIALASDVSEPYMDSGNYSKAILEAYKVIVLRMYSQRDIPPGEKLLNELQPGSVKDQNNNFYGMMVFFVVAVFLGIRSLMVSKKYQRRFLGRKYYNRRHFKAVRKYFDDSGDDGIYTIGYDDDKPQ